MTQIPPVLLPQLLERLILNLFDKLVSVLEGK